MFVLELTFDDDPRRLAARAAHRERLARLHASGDLLIAGPWHDDSGALLVFRTDTAAMDAIRAADPYYTTPGVTVNALRRWTPIIGAPPPPPS
ncbi:YciI family protein [Amycolatopsis japonica]|uniref:YciI family protein n=1 Tax=Amycolatopsis japonica TaxID=208439 RepID=UPI0033CEA1AF